VQVTFEHAVTKQNYEKELLDVICCETDTLHQFMSTGKDGRHTRLITIRSDVRDPTC